MNFLRNLFSSLISSILVCVIFALVVLYNLNSVILNPKTFNFILENNDTYQKIATQLIPEGLAELTRRSENLQVPPVVIKEIFAESVKSNNLSADLEKIITSAHSYVVAQTDQVNVQIDLSSYTKNLKTNLKPALLTYFSKLPSCTMQQQAEFNPGNKSLECRPVGLTDNQILDRLEITQFETELEQYVPKTLTFTETEIKFDPPLAESETNGDQVGEQKSEGTLKSLRKSAQLLKGFEQILILLTVGLTIVLILARLRSVVSITRWVGWAFFGSSIVLLISSSLFLLVITKEKFADFIFDILKIEQRTLVEKTTAEILAANGVDLFRAVLEGIQLYSLILVATGLTLIVASYLYSRNRNKHLDLTNKFTK